MPDPDFTARGEVCEYCDVAITAGAVALFAVLLLPNVAATLTRRRKPAKGKAWVEKGDFDAAIAELTESIRLDPKDANAYCGRGFAYGSRGELDKAIADLTEAIRLNPKLAIAYYNRGRAYKGKGDLDKAVADLDASVETNPSLRPIMRNAVQYGFAAGTTMAALPISTPRFGSTLTMRPPSSRPRPSRRSLRQQFTVARNNSVKCCGIVPRWQNSAKKPEHCTNGRRASSRGKICARAYSGMPPNRFL